MSFWLLDDGPFGLLAEHFNPAWEWPAGRLHLMREVAQAASQDRQGKRSQLLSLQHQGRPSLQVHDLLVGSPAADYLYTYLRPNSARTDKNLGEHASIALAVMQEPLAIFVAMDKFASYLALAELGPLRVAASGR